MNLMDLMIKVGVDDQASSGLDKIVDNAKTAGKNIGNALKTAFDVGTKITTVTAGAMAALTTASVNSYKDYEQLVGGVDTLFKESSKKVQDYADGAFRTSGMSANAYMETVTSFSASLLQSLGGDTAAAADAAQEAVVDMSDNANKMGTSMSMIQNAYQGFAKQNYTMLDNLKLGYGGTQKEMYRLMETAASLDKTFAATAEFSLDEKGHLTAEFADITRAIHIVQTEMGITGTTAKEASTTIQGSVASAKAAWGNMLRTMADDNADFGAAVDNLVGSVGTAFSNLVPRIETALRGVADFVGEVAPVIIEALPQMINTVLPSMLDAIGTVADAAILAVQQIGQDLLEGIAQVFLDFTGIDMMPVIDSLTEVVNLIRDTLGGMLKGIDLAAVADTVNGFLASLGSSISLVLDAARGDTFQVYVNTVKELFTAVGGAAKAALKPVADGVKNLFLAFASGDIGILGPITETIGKFADWISGPVTSAIGIVADGVWKLLGAFVADMAEPIRNIVESLGMLFSSADGRDSVLTVIADAIVRIMSVFVEGLADIITKIATAIQNFVTALADNEGGVLRFSDVIKALGDRFFTVLGYVLDLASEIGDLIVDLSDLESDFSEIFGNLGDIIGTAVGQMAEELDKMISMFKEKFGSLDSLWENSAIGGFLSLFTADGIAKANEKLNEFGEGVWEFGERLFEKATGVHDKAVLQESADIRSGLPTANVPVSGSGIGKVTEDTVNAVIASAGSQNIVITPAPVNLDGRKVAEIQFNNTNAVAKQKGVPVGG